MVMESQILIWIVPLLIWEMIWKGFGLWKAGRNNQIKWFIAIFLLNTVGILPLLYIGFFQKEKNKKSKKVDGWVEKKLKDFKKGKKPTWIEKMALEHAEPVNFTLHIAALFFVVYGLWIKDWAWIAMAVIFGLIGHTYARTRE